MRDSFFLLPRKWKISFFIPGWGDITKCLLKAGTVRKIRDFLRFKTVWNNTNCGVDINFGRKTLIIPILMSDGVYGPLFIAFYP